MLERKNKKLLDFLKDRESEFYTHTYVLYINDVELLKSIARLSDEFIYEKLQLPNNKNITIEILRLLFYTEHKYHNPEMKCAVAANPKADIEMLECVVFNHQIDIDESQMYDIFSHNKLTFNFANKCINGQNTYLKQNIAEYNNNTEIQHILLNHDVEIRKCLARNINIGEDIINILRFDIDDEVRYYLVCNISLSISMLESIINDDNDSWIKQNAFDRLEYLNSEDFRFKKDKV